MRCIIHWTTTVSRDVLLNDSPQEMLNITIFDSTVGIPLLLFLLSCLGGFIGLKL